MSKFLCWATYVQKVRVMKNKLLRFIETLLLVGVLGFALFQIVTVHASEQDCRNLLTERFSSDSRYVSFSAGDLDLPDYGRDYMAYSVKVIRIFLDRIGCHTQDINFGQGAQGSAHSRCEAIVRERENSRMCYVESNLGYWFIHKDFVDDVHIMFHRWD